MKKMFLMVVVVLMFSCLLAESVILNDGRTLKGEIVGKRRDSIYLQSEVDLYLLTRDIVKQIKNDGNLTITKLTYKKKDFLNKGVDITQLTPLPELEYVENSTVGFPLSGDQSFGAQAFMQPKYKTKVNFHNLILGAAFAGIAWDYFNTEDEIRELIEDYEELNYPKKEINKLKKQKNRKFISGVLSSAASIASFVFSFEDVEIKASPTAVEVGYKF